MEVVDLPTIANILVEYGSMGDFQAAMAMRIFENAMIKGLACPMKEGWTIYTSEDQSICDRISERINAKYCDDQPSHDINHSPITSPIAFTTKFLQSLYKK